MDIGLSKYEIQFIKELQDEMKNQETDGQASPRFWVLRQYEYEPTSEEYMDGYQYVYFNGDDADYETFDNTEEMVWYLSINEIISHEDIQELKGLDLNEAFEIILEKHNDDKFFYKTPAMKVEKIIPNTLFLTKESAKEHIRLNHYHYNDTVHTYAMTAWRSPEVALLFKIIEKINFSEE